MAFAAIQAQLADKARSELGGKHVREPCDEQGDPQLTDCTNPD